MTSADGVPRSGRLAADVLWRALILVAGLHTYWVLEDLGRARGVGRRVQRADDEPARSERGDRDPSRRGMLRGAGAVSRGYRSRTASCVSRCGC